MSTRLNELNTLIQQRSAGLAVASREAVVKDVNLNPRHIQRIDFSSNKFESPLSPIISGKNDTDSLDISVYTPIISGSLIEVQDNSMLCVTLEFNAYNNESVIITPIVYDNENPSNWVGTLESKEIVQTYSFNYNNSSYFTPIVAWDILGAWKIGIHVTEWANAGGSLSFNIYAWVI